MGRVEEMHLIFVKVQGLKWNTCKLPRPCCIGQLGDVVVWGNLLSPTFFPTQALKSKVLFFKRNISPFSF